MMLEGMFLWGNKNNFNIVWRGIVKNIVFQDGDSEIMDSLEEYKE